MQWPVSGESSKKKPLPYGRGRTPGGSVFDYELNAFKLISISVCVEAVRACTLDEEGQKLPSRYQHW